MGAQSRLYQACLLGALLAVNFLGTSAAAQGTRGKAVSRAAARSARAQLRLLWMREREAIAKVRARRLVRSRTVFRFVPTETAKLEQARGLRVGAYTTSVGGRGRPLSASTAQKRFGLATRPRFRETLQLPEGTFVKLARILGMKKRYGQIRLAEPVPKEQIQRVLKVR